MNFRLSGGNWKKVHHREDEPVLASTLQYKRLAI
jgi:hypothetical protein